MAGKHKGLPPAYPAKPHRSGQARITVTLTDGRRRCILLGEWGTSESQQRYTELVGTLAANGGRYPCDDLPLSQEGRSVVETVLLFRQDIVRDCRRTDGSLSRNVEHYQMALLPFVDLYGKRLICSIGTQEFRAFRESLVQKLKYRVQLVDRSGEPCWVSNTKVRLKSEHQPEDHAWLSGKWVSVTILATAPALAVNTINQRMRYLKQFIEWAVSQDLAPAALLDAVAKVKDLKQGHAGRCTLPAVQPVVVSDIEATLPYLAPQVAAMVRLQLLTGMRPGEVCLLRGVHILNRDQPTWKIVFDPSKASSETRAEYKLSHLHKSDRSWGKDGKPWVRVIPLGPSAQEVIRPWLRSDDTEFLFQPLEVRVGSGKSRKPRDHYDTHSFARAIARAAKRAGVSHWSPHRIRHTAATRIRQQFGAEGAQVMLGHKRLSSTERYAVADNSLGERIAQSL